MNWNLVYQLMHWQGIKTFQTMRLKGNFAGTAVHILVDSGSTRNILDISFAKKLGFKLEEVTTQSVTIADGSHIVCKHVCKHFEWMMNGKQFETEVMFIPFGSCDMVLGIQWLSTLGPVYWDFSKLKVEFIFLMMNQFHWKGFLKRSLR